MGDQLHVSVDPDIAFLINQVTYHVPAIQLSPSEWIVVAPDIAGDDIGVGELVQDDAKGTDIVCRSEIGIVNQLYAIVID